MLDCWPGRPEVNGALDAANKEWPQRGSCRGHLVSGASDASSQSGLTVAGLGAGTFQAHRGIAAAEPVAEGSSQLGYAEGSCQSVKRRAQWSAEGYVRALGVDTPPQRCNLKRAVFELGTLNKELCSGQIAVDTSPQSGNLKRALFELKAL